MKLIIRSLLLFFAVWSQSSDLVGAEPAGQSLSLSCNGCHGTYGFSASSIPSIAGMGKSEFVQKLRDYKAGNRPASVMDRIARGFDDADFEKMAAWFAGQVEKSHD